MVVSSNLPIKSNGYPYASARTPDDSGVAVYFTYKGRQHCFACDQWLMVRDNIQAIGKTIAALRGIARWGTGDMMERAFAGFSVLPGPEAAGGHHWSQILNVSADAPDAEIRRAYQRARNAAHPDKGGDEQAFQRVGAAWRQARQERGL